VRLKQGEVIRFVDRYKSQFYGRFAGQIALDIADASVHDVLVGDDVRRWPFLAPLRLASRRSVCLLSGKTPEVRGRPPK